MASIRGGSDQRQCPSRYWIVSMCGYEHCGRRLGGFVGKGISKMRLLIHKAIAVVAYAIYLASCSSADDSVPGYENLMTFVANHRVGSDADQWIEMKNLSGSWERTGLIFGYTTITRNVRP